MGLDMYAFSVSAEFAGDTQTNLKSTEADQGRAAPKSLMYWRKFNHLHGWMERLYEQKGGTAVFNCEGVRLMAEDLDQLETDMTTGSLTHTPGFFFGGSELYDDDVEKLKEFLGLAREEIKQGRAVFYDSWW